MAVARAGQHVPPEGAQLFLQRGDRHDVVARAVQLHAIVVHHQDEPLGPEFCRGHDRFPALPLVQAALAHHHHRTERFCGQTRRERHARAHGNAVAQRPGGHVHARRLVHAGVALQHRIQVAEGFERRRFEEAAVRQYGVQQQRCVPLGQHEAVAVGGARIRGVDIQVVEIERRHQIAGRRGAAPVAGLFPVQYVEDLDPEPCGQGGQHGRLPPHVGFGKYSPFQCHYFPLTTASRAGARYAGDCPRDRRKTAPFPRRTPAADPR